MIPHGRSGADFRACRELCGYTQTSAAQNLAITNGKYYDRALIRKWEKEWQGEWHPSGPAWAWMDAELAHHEEEVERILSEAIELHEQGKEVVLVLFAFEDGTDELQNDNRPAAVSNAIVRDAWMYMLAEGIEPTFVYATEAVRYPDAIW